MEKQHSKMEKCKIKDRKNNRMEKIKAGKNLLSGIEIFGIFVLMFCVLIVNVNALNPSQISIDSKSIQISKIYPNSTGTLSFIIANSGGLPAEEIEIFIPSSQNFHIGDTIKIGTLNPGTQQSIQTTIKANDIMPGIYTITVIISYKKQRQTTNYGIERESVDENFYIPVNVYAPPTTELTIKNEQMFINKEQTLNLVITPKTNLRDTSVELISDCLQVVGNSKKYLGNLNANENKEINFSVIPLKKNCNAKLNLIYKAGDYETETLNFGLKANDIFVDFLTEIENKEISPGDALNLTIKAKNLGNVKLDNVKFSLNLPEQFVVINEVFFDEILPNEENTLNFQIYVKSDAETKPYKGKLIAVYEISGNKEQMSKDIGIAVEGKILLVITNYEIKEEKVNVEIANIGTRTANSIILKLGNGYYYIDKIDSTKKRTAVFQLKDVKDAKSLIIEYTGSNNARIKTEEKISLNVEGNAAGKDKGIAPLGILAVVIVIVVIVIAAFYMRKKK